MRQLVTPILCLVLIPMLARGAPPGRALAPVEVREYDGGWGRKGVQLTFKRLPPDREQAPLTREDGRAIVAAFEAEYGKQEPLPPPRYPSGTRVASVGTQSVSAGAPEWQEKIRKDHEALYGTGKSALALPDNLENSRFFQALRLSPQYMGEGAREAAMELFNSPVFIVSMAASMTLYLVALAAPEPFLSKGFVATLTLWLMWTYGATELLNVAMAVKQLYEEAEAAQSFEQLDRAARNFGPKVGATALRVLVTIAIGRLAGKLPEVPKAPGGGGLWGRLGTPRYALARNVTLQGTPVVQGAGAQVTVFVGEAATAETSVANGTVLLMGALVGTEASAATAAIKAARTTGGCREDNSKGDAPEHHIATNKNGKAEVRGGPWTPQFEEFFEQAGMSLDDPANKLFVVGHKGPHPEEYHRIVYNKLRNALGRCRTMVECRTGLNEALDELASEICKPGSDLNKHLTREP
ncbi:AHH domain-containing protein [Vitiosangium sp. GDMCC 1.1324]|uniref:AHH domain-containing protein n=1 Tax=Vitiosangium sp. (strain GDMCC 1.1324) TaxID=2138576 RepID=UPI000D35431F|nr:AHH domain-containing protein [Vitiosangium sp. GDMCC 1.1324]PTL76051.1 hypothetical protein DAT35_51960 [Vitiosangium sp. GDMCC 1.1324]